jgi:hypothetical protein
MVVDFGETSDLQHVRRLQKVAELLLANVNLAIVHKPGWEKTFIMIIKTYFRNSSSHLLQVNQKPLSSFFFLHFVNFV